MVTITYKKYSNGDPAKVSSGMMDRLFFNIILQMKEIAEIKNPKTFSLSTMLYMSRVRGQTTCPSLHCIFAVGSDMSILRAPMAAAISPFMSPLNPPKS